MKDGQSKKNRSHKAKMFYAGKGEHYKNAYQTAVERKFKGVLTPFQKYINSQATASIFLLLCTLIGLAWASLSTFSYERFTKAPLGFHIFDFDFSRPLTFWSNDVLLTLFFFFVGLEIKREFLVGSLTDKKRAFFVLFGAIGGMVFPVIFYLVLNAGTDKQVGWGIPMATDTAFVLGVLSCFKNRLPKDIFTFLAALAIVDDIGAILVIAIFYTPQVNVNMLCYAFLMTALLGFLNYLGFRKALPYILIGLLIWVAIEEASVHGTIAGILVAFIIPARPQRGPRQFIKKMQNLLNAFEKRKNEIPLVLQDEKQHQVLEKLQEIAQEATTPLQRFASKLQLPISLLILPLFALVNAGIPVDFHLLGELITDRASLGIMCGLCLGKPIGILLFGQLSSWLKLGMMPDNTSFRQIMSVSVLTGIGFTMSLFISELSFSEESTLLLVKGAILLSSVISAIIGVLLIWVNTQQDLRKPQ